MPRTAMIEIDSDNLMAKVTINGKIKEVPIKKVADKSEEHGPFYDFVSPLYVGVFIGVSGKSVWFSDLYINKIGEKFVGIASRPLNTVNRQPTFIRDIFGFWEDVPDNLKSKR